MSWDQIEMFATPPAAPVPAKRTRTARIKSVESKRPGTKPYWKKTIAERYAEFDAAHPEVHQELRRLALELMNEGARRISVNQLYEVARYNLRSRVDVEEGGFRVNNSFRSLTARRLIEEIPALAGLIETRELRSA